MVLYSALPARLFPIVVTVVTLTLFWVLDTHDALLFKMLASETQGWTRVGALGLYRYGLPWLVAPLLIALLLFGPSRAIGALGLKKSPLKGVLFGLVVTAPMLAVLIATGVFTPPDQPFLEIARGAVYPGFFEEVFYRAFLFGFLCRFAGWGFLPAALIGALIFGAGHLYQSSDPMEAAAIFAITALGGLWFAWLYVEWDYNIWVPASVHALMNLWWMLFAVAETALGSPLANASRLVVITLSIVITVLFARRRGGRKTKGRAWLWRGEADMRA